MLQSLKHKNIVEIIGAIHEPDISLVMEYVQHGSLQTYLKINKETLKPESLLKFALDVASVRRRENFFFCLELKTQLCV